MFSRKLLDQNVLLKSDVKLSLGLHDDLCNKIHNLVEEDQIFL